MSRKSKSDDAEPQFDPVDDDAKVDLARTGPVAEGEDQEPQDGVDFSPEDASQDGEPVSPDERAVQVGLTSSNPGRLIIEDLELAKRRVAQGDGTGEILHRGEIVDNIQRAINLLNVSS